MCVSTDILNEYAEIITQKMSVEVATNVIHLLLESEFVELVNPYFGLHLIEADHDDDKFVDCAFTANATFIVSDDKHYDVETVRDRDLDRRRNLKHAADNMIYVSPGYHDVHVRYHGMTVFKESVHVRPDETKIIYLD